MLLYSEFASDPDMADLIEMFLDDLPDRAAALQQAATCLEMSALARLAHQLKGAAGGYGYPSISEAAAELEHATTPAAIQLHAGRVVSLCHAALAVRQAQQAMKSA